MGEGLMILAPLAVWAGLVLGGAGVFHLMWWAIGRHHGWGPFTQNSKET